MTDYNKQKYVAVYDEFQVQHRISLTFFDDADSNTFVENKYNKSW